MRNVTVVPRNFYESSVKAAVERGEIRDWSIGVTSAHEGVDLVVNKKFVLTALRDSGA